MKFTKKPDIVPCCLYSNLSGYDTIGVYHPDNKYKPGEEVIIFNLITVSIGHIIQVKLKEISREELASKLTNEALDRDKPLYLLPWDLIMTLNLDWDGDKIGIIGIMHSEEEDVK